MSDKPYTPHADSLPGRVVSYFARLPDEELSNVDIAVKWEADAKNVPAQLKLSVDAGLLARDGMVYTAGAEIGRIDLTPQAVAISATPVPKKPKPRIAPPVDIEAVEFEDAPPAVEEVRATVHTRWVAKLKTMPAGKSFTMPREHGNSLRAAATELNKQGWRVSVLADGEDKVCVVCRVVGGSQ